MNFKSVLCLALAVLGCAAVAGCRTSAAQSMHDLSDGREPDMLTLQQHRERFFKLAADMALRENSLSLKGLRERCEQGTAGEYEVDYARRTACDGAVHGESGLAPSQHLEFERVLIVQLYIATGAPRRQPGARALNTREKNALRSLVAEAVRRYGCCHWVHRLAPQDDALAEYQTMTLADAARLHFSHHLVLTLTHEQMAAEAQARTEQTESEGKPKQAAKS